MAVNRIDLLHHTFSRSLRGYNPEEVDALLQDAADTIARLSDERVRLHNHIHRLEQAVAAADVREENLRETLKAAQKAAEDIKAGAQKEAQNILEAARIKAESLSRQAEVRLAGILDEISEARKLKAQFEFKVRSVIEGHLKLLELGKAEDAQAAFGPGRRIGPRGEETDFSDV